MILRVCAALALALGVAAFLLFLGLVGKAPWSPPEMRRLRARKDRVEAPSAYDAVTVADIESLPHGVTPAARAGLEARGVSFDGWVQRMLTAPDGDFHFELVGTPRRPGGPDTCYVTAEITPQWSRGSETWAYESLVALLRPNQGGATPWDGGPRRARVSGWLLHDYQHDIVPSSWSLRNGAPRLSGWEIHPVTRLELWSDSLGRFVDVPR